jgi:hypothetical protein
MSLTLSPEALKLLSTLKQSCPLNDLQRLKNNLPTEQELENLGVDLREWIQVVGMAISFHTGNSIEGLARTIGDQLKDNALDFLSRLGTKDDSE